MINKYLINYNLSINNKKEQITVENKSKIEKEGIKKNS